MCTLCGERNGTELEAITEMVDFLTEYLAEMCVNDGIETITYTETTDRDTGYRCLSIEVIRR